MFRFPREHPLGVQTCCQAPKSSASSLGSFKWASVTWFSCLCTELYLVRFLNNWQQNQNQIRKGAEMAIYGVGTAEYLASLNPHGTALREHTEQAHILRVMLERLRGHTGAVKLHNSFGNSHCTELTSTFGCGSFGNPWIWRGITSN